MRVELSRQTGVSMYTLAQLYYDKWHGVSRSTVDAICKTLGVQVGDLFEYVEMEERSKREKVGSLRENLK